MGEVEWERARLFPISGIGGADEQERRASSALLAVIQSVKEFGRALTAPMGAPTGRLSTFIEVPFDDGDKKLRPDGLIQVVSGHRTWTALVEIKTGRHDLIPGQIESYNGRGAEAEVRCPADYFQSGGCCAWRTSGQADQGQSASSKAVSPVLEPDPNRGAG